MTQPIEELKGLGEDNVQKLKEIGIDTIEQLATEHKVHLADVCEVKESIAAKWITMARNRYEVAFIPAQEKKEWLASLGRISTGSKALDEVLKGININEEERKAEAGGVLLQSLTELAGAYGSGKTQMCFTLSIIAQLPPEQGGMNGAVFYIDTESTFRTNRIEEIAKARGLDPTKAIENIYVQDAPTSDELMLTISNLGAAIEKFNSGHEAKVKLIIVDSLMAPFRADYIGRGELAPRQQAMGRCLQELQRFAKKYDCAGVFTNQVVAIPDFIGMTIPAGGHTVAHKAQYRLFLRKSKENTRIVRVIDAPDIVEQDIVIKVSEKGVEDVPTRKERAEKVEDVTPKVG